MSTLTALATVLGLGFTAGVNLYATVLATGLALRLDWLALPASLGGLAVLGDTRVLVVAGLCYAAEFVADKVPAVDHAWDLVHAFVRPAGAALVAWAAVSGASLDPAVEVAAVVLAAGTAFGSHAAKSGTRLATAAVGGHALGLGVVLSLLEDVVALALAPLAVLFPLFVAALVLVAAGLAVWLLPKAVRAVRGRLSGPAPGRARAS